METPIVYVICDKNCKFEGMTKEQIYTAILQAVNEGTIGNIDAGFVTTIKTINGLPLKFFVGEQAAYDELTAEQKNNLFAIITNDTTKEGITKAIMDLQTTLEGLLKGLGDGSFVVKLAEKANSVHGEVMPAFADDFWDYNSNTNKIDIGFNIVPAVYSITVKDGTKYLNFLIALQSIAFTIATPIQSDNFITFTPEAENTPAAFTCLRSDLQAGGNIIGIRKVCKFI